VNRWNGTVFSKDERVSAAKIIPAPIGLAPHFELTFDLTVNLSINIE